MALWTTPTTHASGDTLAVTDWNAVANNETFLYEAPYARYYNSVAVAVASNALTQITLGGTSFSGYSFSVSSNNAIIPIVGIYWAYGASGLGTTTQQTLLYKNGSIYDGQTNLGTVSDVIKCSVNDTIGMYGYQSSGSSINSSATSTGCWLSLFFVGSA